MSQPMTSLSLEKTNINACSLAASQAAVTSTDLHLTTTTLREPARRRRRPDPATSSLRSHMLVRQPAKLMYTITSLTESMLKGRRITTTRLSARQLLQLKCLKASTLDLLNSPKQSQTQDHLKKCSSLKCWIKAHPKTKLWPNPTAQHQLQLKQEEHKHPNPTQLACQKPKRKRRSKPRPCRWHSAMQTISTRALIIKKVELLRGEAFTETKRLWPERNAHRANVEWLLTNRLRIVLHNPRQRFALPQKANTSMRQPTLHPKSTNHFHQTRF